MVHVAASPVAPEGTEGGGGLLHHGSLYTVAAAAGDIALGTDMWSSRVLHNTHTFMLVCGKFVDLEYIVCCSSLG